jgi:hypothetical protein
VNRGNFFVPQTKKPGLFRAPGFFNLNPAAS